MTLSCHQLLYSRSGSSEVGADGPDNLEHADGGTLKRRLACMCDASLLSFFVVSKLFKLDLFQNLKLFSLFFLFFVSVSFSFQNPTFV